MKRIVSVIFFSLCISSVMAQGRFKIEPLFSVHYPLFPSTMRLGSKDYKNFEASFASYYRGTLGGTVNRSIGFQGEVPVHPRLSIRIGAAYSPKDFTGDRVAPCNCNSETAKEPIMFKQRYVDVPLSIRYYVHAKRTFVFVETGAVLNVLVMNKTRFISHDQYSKSHVSSIDDISLNKYMVGVSAGAGVGYAFTPRIDLSLAVSYRQVLTEYAPTDNYRPAVIVANVGLSVKIGREKSQ